MDTPRRPLPSIGNPRMRLDRYPSRRYWRPLAGEWPYWVLSHPVRDRDFPSMRQNRCRHSGSSRMKPIKGFTSSQIGIHPTSKRRKHSTRTGIRNVFFHVSVRLGGPLCVDQEKYSRSTFVAMDYHGDTSRNQTVLSSRSILDGEFKVIHGQYSDLMD